MPTRRNTISARRKGRKSSEAEPQTRCRDRISRIIVGSPGSWTARVREQFDNRMRRSHQPTHLKPPRRVACLGVVAAILISGAALPTLAETILSTGFEDRTVSGNTASNIPWTASGALDPGDLTVTNEAPGALSGLFLTGDASVSGTLWEHAPGYPARPIPFRSTTS